MTTTTETTRVATVGATNTISMQPASTNTLQPQSFPHCAFAAINGCGDWVKEKHVKKIIQKAEMNGGTAAVAAAGTAPTASADDDRSRDMHQW